MDSSRRTSSLTEEQLAALTTRDVSVALAAGAGCGKTHVLTERFISHLEPGRGGVDLGEIVAITFTERAAREMRQRIRAAVHQRLATANQDAEHWLQLVRRMDSARISTIHAFCAALLRSNAIAAQLDPQFGVLEEAQAASLLAEATDDLLRALLTNRDENLRALLGICELRDLRNDLRALVANRHRDAMQPWLERSLSEIVAEWERFFREDHPFAVAQNLLHHARFLEVCALVEVIEPQTPHMKERFAGIRACRGRLAATPPDLSAIEDLDACARVQGPGSKAWAQPDEMEAFKNAAKRLRDIVKSTRDLHHFDGEGAQLAAELGQRLLAVSRELAQAYEARKAELGVLDFDDLLLRARDLLCGPDSEAVRRQVSTHIKVLLIDEFQDTDRAQVELAEAICDGAIGSGKLFFVGDHKQSIYRFRGAEPEVFHDLRSRIPPAGRLPLSRNFRSQPAILDFVNAVFAHEFSEYQPLVPHRRQVTPPPAIEFLWAEVPKDAAETDPDLDSSAEGRRKLEADWLARRLRQIVDSGEPVVWNADAAKHGEPAARPARQGDIALLFRAMSSVQLYEDALRRWGFDYYVVGGQAFYAQQEIFDVLNLLRAIASPADTLSLVGALRSPIFALEDETIFWLAQAPEGLRAALFGAPPAALTHEQRGRVQFAAETLRELIELRDRRPVAELLATAFARTGYDAALLAEFLGERQLANLHKLTSQARQFDASGTLTLADYIRQLADFVVHHPREPLAATHPESHDVVRLMSIHQAKGLEFPIVALPDLERMIRKNESVAVFDPRLGPLVKPRGEKTRSIGGWEMYQAREKQADMAEHARLLYVATTRAADLLILSAGCEAADQATSPWRELLARHFNLITGQYIGQRAAGQRVPEVRVITEPPAVVDPPHGRSRSPDLEQLVETIRTTTTADPQIPRSVAPCPVDYTARRTFSFSRLSGALEAEERGDEVESAVEAPLVDGSAGEAVDGRSLGVLIHAALAEWMRHRSTNPADAIVLVERLAAQQDLLGAAETAEATALLQRFVASRRAAELIAATEVHAELEFLLNWPHAGRDLLIRGFIDCLYRDAQGAWHLLDYKSERIGSVTAAAAPYRLQAVVYALAVETSLRVAPREIVLHFLRSGEEHAFQLDDDARRWAAEEIARRIAALWQTPAESNGHRLESAVASPGF